jgi:transcriptional regulator with XRE-family HTH domain
MQYNHYYICPAIIQCLTPDNLSMPDTDFSLGSRLRSLRKERDLSQRKLAVLAGLSPNAVSLIERGEISPSVATLQRLAGALSVRVSLFFDNLDEMRVVYSRTGRRPQIASKHANIEGLGAQLVGQEMEPFLVTLAPGADTCATFVAHSGHEFVCCLAGVLEYVVAGTAYPLNPGEYLMFEANLPHCWRNATEQGSRFLLVLHSPSGPGDPAQGHFTDHPSVAHLG